MPKINIENRSLSVEANPVMSILNNLIIQKVEIQTQCGGKGNCTLCAIRVKKGGEFMSPPSEREMLILEKPLLDKGLRLSCQSYASQDITVFVPDTREEARKLTKDIY